MGILKTTEDYQAITLKGLPKDADTSFFSSSLVEGRLPNFGAEDSNELLIRETSQRLESQGRRSRLRLLL